MGHWKKCHTKLNNKGRILCKNLTILEYTHVNNFHHNAQPE